MTSSSSAPGGPSTWSPASSGGISAIGHGRVILELPAAVGDIEFVILLLAAAAVLVRLAELIHVPYPIVLVVGGLAIGLVPGLRDLALDPHVVFVVFLPPLLHAAGWYSSPRELRAEVRPLALLAVGLVLATMAAVAVVAHAIVPGMSWEAAFVLGAIVGPTDPVSATATFSRIGAPARVRLLVEGEAMINDGTALVAYRVALVAATEGVFSFGDALVDFAVSATGGVAIGLAAGWLVTQAVRRQSDVALSIFITVIVAYGGYVVAEEAGVSGVLAAVTSGIYAGWNAHRAMDAGTRLSGIAFWRVMTFGLEALLFVLLGLQAPRLAERARRRRARAAGAGGRRHGDRGADAVDGDPVRRDRQQRARADRGRLGGDARCDLARCGARRADRGAGAPGDPAADVRRDRRHAARPGADAGAAAAATAACRARTRSRPTRRSRGWRPRRRRSTGSTSSRRRARPPEPLRRLRELYRARFAVCVAVLGGGELPEDGRRELRDYGAMRRELIAVERASLLALRNDGPRRPGRRAPGRARPRPRRGARSRASGLPLGTFAADDRADRSREHGATGWRRSASRAGGCWTRGSPSRGSAAPRRAIPGPASWGGTRHRTSSPPRPGATSAAACGRSPSLTVIGSLAEPPADAHDAYLRLHLLSHRLIRPHEADLSGLFGVLANVAWTSDGPVDPAALGAVRMRFRAAGRPFSVTSVDKFPRMTDYVVPPGVRIADADRVRLGAHLAEGTTVMHEGFVNFNAGTLGASMVEGRISAGVVVGDGSDIGGGASIMGTLSGGGTAVISIGERCLLGANAGLGISLGDDCIVEAGPLRHRRLARRAARTARSSRPPS